MTLPSRQQAPPIESVLIVRLFELPCVFCGRPADRLLVYPLGVRTVHEGYGPPCDFVNPTPKPRTCVVRTTTQGLATTVAAGGGLTTRRSA